MAPAFHVDPHARVTRAELLSIPGVDSLLIEHLEAFGLITARAQGQHAAYDGAARTICELAARFRDLGIEVRHLRAWKTAAERESSLFEQRVSPLLRQRNPQAREQSAALVDELASLGGKLRGILIAQALGPYHT
jgi:phage terminase Nu1 subunit (DNA packaging protein)